MRRHVGTEVLASYREGDVSRRKAAWIRAHLAGCARCSGVNSDLAAVSNVLAGVQLPPMPEHLAMRIQGALATESAQRAAGSPGLAATTPGSGAAGDHGTVTVPGRPDLPERSRGSRRLRRPDLASPLLLRTLAAAGAVVILAGGGYLVASESNSATSTADSGSQGAPSDHSASAAGPRIPGSEPVNGPSQPTFIPYGAHGQLRAVAETSSIDFEPATLGARIRQQLAHVTAGFYRLPAPAATASHSTPAPSAGRIAMSGPVVTGLSLARLAACVTLVAASREVRLVEIALYRSAPAEIIVTAVSPVAKTLSIVVVSRACSGTKADIIAEFTVPVR
jgi:putative zinc finger protein